jgi:hypothetical protein
MVSGVLTFEGCGQCNINAVVFFFHRLRLLLMWKPELDQENVKRVLLDQRVLNRQTPVIPDLF